MEGEELGELVLKRLLILKNGRRVSQDSTHVSSEGLHILGNEDSVVGWWVSGGLPSITLGIDREAKMSLILVKLILV